VKTDPLTFLQLAAVVVIWWFAILAVAGKRFGMFHWLPVAICCFAIPLGLADLLRPQPEMASWGVWTWHGIGLLLAAVYFGRAPRKSRRAQARERSEHAGGG
jgi:hypothetical protein